MILQGHVAMPHVLLQGWHLTDEPDFTPNAPTPDQRGLTEYRADLVKAYRQAVEEDDENEADELREEVAKVDAELRQLGVRGNLPSLEPRPGLLGSGLPSGGRMRRTCLVGRSRNAPWARCSARSTSRPRFSR
jgi:hypothetical protein